MSFRSWKMEKRLQLGGVDARLVVVGIGEVVALLLEPGDEVDIRPADEAVHVLGAVLRAVERDLDRASRAGDRLGPAVLVEVEGLSAPSCCMPSTSRSA